jgi:probable phosphoglycerate mutase
MRLYIIRHADPDYPNNTLTAAGHLEATALARRMASHGLDAIYSSPMPRAHITAQYTADLTKLPISVQDWLVEVAGFDYMPDPLDEGMMPAWDIPGEILRENDAYLNWETWDKTPPFDAPIYRETFHAFAEASDAMLARHGCIREGRRYRIEQDNRQQIAAYCHNGTALLWLCLLLHIPPALVWSSFWHAPSAVTTVLFECRSEHHAVPRCLSVGDTRHLYEARLPIQPRGIRGNYY